MIILAPVVLTLVYLRLYLSIFVAALIILGLTRLPDWDMHLAGVRHRGITHTVTFAVSIGLVMGGVLIGLASGLNEPLRGLPDMVQPHIPRPSTLEAFTFGFVTGFLSIIAHLLGDIITPTGIRPLVPFNDTRYRYPITRASDPLGNIMLFLVGAGLVISAIFLGLILNGTLPQA